jgi:hypothetical protein
MHTSRRKLTALLVRTSIVLAILAVPATTLAMEQGLYSMEILVNGSPLQEHLARNTRYVEACEDCEYSIRLRNRTGRRIAVALSVDGLNTIDAKTTTAREAAKWILDPYQTIKIDGWQTSSSIARRFFFTTEDDSYGAWMGKTRNLGIITAAVFREVVPQPLPYPTPITREDERRPAAAKTRTKAGERLLKQSRDRDPGRFEESVELAEDLAATGIGRELDHRVRKVRFRAEPAPATVMQVRYEFRDALARLGVVPWPHAHLRDPLERRESARGFEDMDFAPDPHR